MLGNILLDLQRDIPLSLSGLQSCPNPLVLKPHHCVTGISYRLCSKQLFWNTYLLIHWFCLLLALLNIVTLAFFISFIEVVFKMSQWHILCLRVHFNLRCVLGFFFFFLSGEAFVLSWTTLSISVSVILSVCVSPFYFSKKNYSI